MMPKPRTPLIAGDSTVPSPPVVIWRYLVDHHEAIADSATNWRATAINDRFANPIAAIRKTTEGLRSRLALV